MSDEPILSTKERPGLYDAFETLKPGEPFFLLQGGDPLTPPTILFWADLERTAARKEQNPERARKLRDKANNAEEVAWKMEEYQRGTEYEAAKEKVAAEDQFATDRAVQLARGCDRLSNAIAEIAEFADKLQAMDDFITERGKLRQAVEIIRAQAKTLEPRRQRREAKS